MTGVAELLASLPASAPVQRVRNYHLTDREARPRPRDFLTALRRSGGRLGLRWPGPPGDRYVRYDGGEWACAEHNRFTGRATVESVDVDRVRAWLRTSRPELVAGEQLDAAFADAHTPGTSTDPGADAGSAAAIADGGRPPETARVRVERYADLREDPDLDRADADALAAALPAASGEMVFRLPRVLAAESVLESVPGSDCVFRAEPVPERATESAHYVRQDRRGCWVPKDEVAVYELAEGASLDRDAPGARESKGRDAIDARESEDRNSADARESPESA